MISQKLQEQAVCYALGILPPEEQAHFEQKLGRDPELRQLVEEMGGITSLLPFGFDGAHEPGIQPDLKRRILSAIDTRHALVSFGKQFESLVAKPHEAIVVTDNRGIIQWVNPTFTALCGYELHELRGKKPSDLLQGKLTDPIAVQRIRDAIQSHKPWTEELINYAKDGTPYWVSISISPILDENLQPRCFVAIEHEIGDRAVAA